MQASCWCALVCFAASAVPPRPRTRRIVTTQANSSALVGGDLFRDLDSRDYLGKVQYSCSSLLGRRAPDYSLSSSSRAGLGGGFRLCCRCASSCWGLLTGAAPAACALPGWCCLLVLGGGGGRRCDDGSCCASRSSMRRAAGGAHHQPPAAGAGSDAPPAAASPPIISAHDAILITPGGRGAVAATGCGI